MNPLDQFLVLITPVAVIIAVASGVAFAWVTHHLRPDADIRLVTYLVVVLSVLWYAPQAAAAWASGFGPWSTSGRWALFLLGFVVPMSATLRWLQRRDE